MTGVIAIAARIDRERGNIVSDRMTVLILPEIETGLGI